MYQIQLKFQGLEMAANETYKFEHVVYVVWWDAHAIVLDEKEAMGRGCFEDLATDIW
jgi:hypothetical protein